MKVVVKSLCGVGLPALVGVLFALSSWSFVSAYPDGAPDGTTEPDNACPDQFPSGHGVNWQSVNPAYVLTPSSPTLTAGTPITLSISSTQSSYLFKGHLLSASFEPASLLSTSNYAGTWSVLDSLNGQLRCNSRAVTHTINAGGSAGLSSITYQYTPPPTPGFLSIVFNITIVRDLTSIYHFSLILPEAPQVPSAPSSLQLANVTITDSLNSLTVKFSPSTLTSAASPAINSYFVECDNGTNSYAVVYAGLPTLSADNLLFSAPFPVPNAVTVHIRVRSQSPAGYSNYSSIFSFTSFAAGTVLSPPAVPTLNSSSVSYDEIDLVWTHTSDALPSIFLGYVLQITKASSSSSSPTPALDTWQTIYTGFAASFVATTLQPGSSYLFRVSAINVVGASPVSSPPLSVSTLPCPSTGCLPADVTSLNVTALAPTSFTLTWATVDNFLPVHYVLQVLSSSSSWQQVYVGMTTSFNISNALTISPSTAYTFRVFSQTRLGNCTSFPVLNVVTPSLASLCPNNCSGHGTCVASLGVCSCDTNYVDAACSILAATSLINAPFCFTSSFCMQWRVIEQTVYMRIIYTESLANWFAVGIGAADGMTGATIFRGALAPPSYSTLSVSNLHSSGFTTPLSDTQQSVSLQNAAGIVMGEKQEIRFTRSLTTANPADTVIPSLPGNFIAGSYAAGALPFNQHDNTKGRFQIDFVGGQARLLGGVNYARLYAPLLVALAAIGTVALLTQLPSLRSARWLHCRLLSSLRLLNERSKHKTSLPSTSSTSRYLFDTLTLNLDETLSDLTVLELLCVALYLAGLGVFIALGVKQFQDVSLSGNYIVGHLVSFHLALALLPAARNSLLLSRVFGASAFERWIKFHRWCSRTAWLCIWVHLFTMLFNVFTPSRLTESQGVVAGFIAFLSINVTAVLAFEPVRRYFFELFYYSHMVLLPVTIVFACLHTSIFFFSAIAPLALYVFDRLLRVVRSHRSVHVTQCQLLSSPQPSTVPTVLQLQLQCDGFEYECGQYVFVRVDQVSRLQWHPFSIVSAPTQPGAPFTICMADFASRQYVLAHQLHPPLNAHHHHVELASTVTVAASSVAVALPASASAASSADSDPASFVSSVCKRVSELNSPNSPPLSVHIDGPYGRVPFHLFDFEVVVLVGGGIGITPLLSIASFLLQQADNELVWRTLQHVHLIWVTKHEHCVRTWFPHQLQALAQHSKRFHLHLYSTSNTSDNNYNANTQHAGGDEVEMQQSSAGSIGPGQQLNASSYTSSSSSTAPSQHEQFHSLTSTLASVSVTPSRPDLHALFEEIRKTHGDRKGKGVAHLCGPPQLMSDAHKAAINCDFLVTKETFLL